VLVRVEVIGPGPVVTRGDQNLSVKPIPWTSVLRFYDVATGKKFRQTLAGFGISACVFSPDGRSLATVNRNNTLSLWETTTGKERGKLPGGSVLAFSPDGKTLAVGSGSVLKLVNLLSAKVTAEFRGHQSNITTVAFAPDGQRVVSGSSDTTLLVWDVTKAAGKG
jgi:WD40 repeat protein